MTFKHWRVPAEWLWAQDIAIVTIAVLLAILLHALAMRVLTRTGRRRTRDAREAVLGEIRTPSRWVVVSIAVSFATRFLSMDREVRDLWQQVQGFAVPALMGWLAVSMLHALQRFVELRADITVEDNLTARRQRTRATILACRAAGDLPHDCPWQSFPAAWLSMASLRLTCPSSS